MPKFLGLDIPEGLIDAFNRIFSVVDSKNSLNYKHRPSGKTKFRRTYLDSISLFVLWQDLYNGFTLGRKGAWTAYWITLPFGSHGGANGYPGSGFSAFVYVNAPRYRAGLDLLLDPPSSYGPEMVTNGTFEGNADHWVLDYYATPFVYSDGVILCTSGDWIEEAGAINDNAFAIENDTNWHYSFDLFFDTAGAGPGDFSFSMQLGTVSGGSLDWATIATAGDTGGETVTIEGTYHFGYNDPETYQINFFAYSAPDSVISIDNVSFRQIL